MIMIMIIMTIIKIITIILLILEKGPVWSLGFSQQKHINIKGFLNLCSCEEGKPFFEAETQKLFLFAKRNKAFLLQERKAKAFFLQGRKKALSL